MLLLLRAGAVHVAEFSAVRCRRYVFVLASPLNRHHSPHPLFPCPYTLPQESGVVALF